MDAYLNVKSLNIYSLSIEQAITGGETQYVKSKFWKANPAYSPLVFESL